MSDCTSIRCRTWSDSQLGSLSSKSTQSSPLPELCTELSCGNSCGALLFLRGGVAVMCEPGFKLRSCYPTENRARAAKAPYFTKATTGCTKRVLYVAIPAVRRSGLSARNSFGAFDHHSKKNFGRKAISCVLKAILGL